MSQRQIHATRRQSSPKTSMADSNCRFDEQAEKLAHRAHAGLVVLGTGLSALIGIGPGCIGCLFGYPGSVFGAYPPWWAVGAGTLQAVDRKKSIYATWACVASWEQRQVLRLSTPG